MSENKNILKELGINENISFEKQITLIIFCVFLGVIDAEKVKQICKEHGFEKYIKDFEMLGKKNEHI